MILWNATHSNSRETSGQENPWPIRTRSHLRLSSSCSFRCSSSVQAQSPSPPPPPKSKKKGTELYLIQLSPQTHSRLHQCSPLFVHRHLVHFTSRFLLQASHQQRSHHSLPHSFGTAPMKVSFGAPIKQTKLTAYVNTYFLSSSPSHPTPPSLRSWYLKGQPGQLPSPSFIPDKSI